MNFYGDLPANLLLGFVTALQPMNLLLCTFGVTLGMLIGVLPGVGSLAAIALLLPVTFHLDPAGALIMLAGVYYGGNYGGSTAAILLNLPGTSSSAVACFDGYPMSQQGRGGIALLITAVASFLGATVGILLLIGFAPLIASVGLQFGPAEYFSIIVLGLLTASAISTGSIVKAVAMATLGIAFGTIGLDMYTGATRFTFGQVELFDGIDLVAVALALFGISEVIASVRENETNPTLERKKVTMRAMIPTREDWRRSWGAILRGSGVGSFFGTLPGTGATLASFTAYAVERRIGRYPAEFGKGAIEGVAAPEAANNASDQTAFIPTLTLGIPGTPTMALMLGALMIHGISPGPGFMVENPDIAWGLIMSFWVGNLILLVLNIPLIGVWIRVLSIPYNYLFPAIIVFVCVGTYSVSNSVFDVWMVLAFGAAGYLFRAIDCPVAPFILGFVLGPMLEEEFRRAMLISRDGLWIFLERPISAGFLLVAFGIVALGVWTKWKERARRTPDPA